MSSSAARKQFLEWVPARRLRALETRRDSACGLLPDLTIAYVNPAWQRFAEANGGGRAVRRRWCEGANFLHAIKGPLNGYYQVRLRACLDGGERWVSRYECSSPSEFRLFRMSVEPVAAGRVLVVRNTLLERRTLLGSAPRNCPPDPRAWCDADGLIQQCVHCRRVRRAATEKWDWIPEWVACVPDCASGTLCPQCVASRYPDLVPSAVSTAQGAGGAATGA